MALLKFKKENDGYILSEKGGYLLPTLNTTDFFNLI